MLVKGKFLCEVPLSVSLENILLNVPEAVLLQLVHSAQGDGDVSDVSAVMAASKELRRFQFTFDSGSEVHLLTLSAAMSLFSDQQASNLRVIGVSGAAVRADLMGHLIIAVLDPVTDQRYHIDLGLSHGMASCPMNLLSVSLLIKAGAVVHFQEGDCYFQPRPGSAKVPFTQEGGMFQLLGEHVDASPAETPIRHAYLVNGHCFATSGDLQLWHRRLRHMDKERLLQIFRHGLVDGFKLTGRITTTCDSRLVVKPRLSGGQRRVSIRLKRYLYVLVIPFILI